jgi:mono/diheme cytochrome c family protein
MVKPFMILVALLLCAFLATAQESQAPAQAPKPSSSTIPADAVHQVNPVKPTAESLAQGKKYYGYDCAMCHGDNGNGKGEVAVSEKMKIGDFSNPATLKDKTDGELFYIIKNGEGQMPPEGDRVKSTELWNIVNYVRSLSNKRGQ